MAETVEAIQVYLHGWAFILWPGSRDNPPKYITDWGIMAENPRFFESPNPFGPVFEYKRNEPLKSWEFVRVV